MEEPTDALVLRNVELGVNPRQFGDVVDAAVRIIADRHPPPSTLLADCYMFREYKDRVFLERDE